ncbi:site-specific integrase [soil metagenome]
MATIESYETRDGRRYRVRYRKPDNSQTDKRGFKTKKEAELFLAEVELGKASGTYIDPTQARITVGSFGDAWMLSRAGLKPSSIAVMESSWRLHVRPRWGSVQLGRVRRSDVEAWIIDLLRPAVGRPLSPSSIHRCHGLLSGILEAAVRDRRLPSNPAKGISLPTRELREHRYLSHEKVFELAAAAGTHRTLVMTLAYTGLRWGEATGLRVKDVDFTKNRFWVRQNAVFVKGFVVVGTPKTHQQRMVPFPSFLREGIDAAVLGKGEDELVFPGRFGEHLITPTKQDGSWYERALRIAELPPMTIHDLRHTAASLAVSAGANVKAIQKMLGHKSAAMTLDVYADLFDNDLSAVAQRLDDVVRASFVGKMWAKDQIHASRRSPRRPKSPELRASSEGGTRTRDTTIMSRVL